MCLIRKKVYRSIEIKDPMDQIVAQRQSVHAFWEKYRDTVSNIRSVDEIYDQYVKYVDEMKIPDLRRVKDPETKKLSKDQFVSMGFLPPINRYIFRTMIRKMGYKNGQVVSQVNQVVDKKDKEPNSESTE